MLIAFCFVVIALLQLALAVLILKVGYELEEALIRAREAESREAALLRQRHTMELMVRNAQKVAGDLAVIHAGKGGATAVIPPAVARWLETLVRQEGGEGVATQGVVGPPAGPGEAGAAGEVPGA